jgi:hypothetical protein
VRAKDLEDAVGLETDEYQRYLDLIDRRNGLRAASIATGAVGLGLVVTGVVMFALDRPQVEIPLYDRNRETAKAGGPKLTVSARPGGGGLRLVF